jgi:hypothetical protein
MAKALSSEHEKPQPSTGPYRRMILPQPMSLLGTGQPDTETELMAQLGPQTVFMMGDNPALSKMPEKPKLLDFFRHRFTPFTRNHLLQSANVALKTGMEEKVVLACLLHDIAISWAVRNHQALRFFADESVGYKYPEAYVKFFGPDYEPEEYVQRAYAQARQHRWYMTSRLITLNDLYSFDPNVTVDPELFTDIIGRHFKQPPEGLGFDSSAVSHMWRTMIWPNNLL